MKEYISHYIPYIAGIIDGEGCIGIHQNGNHPLYGEVSVSMCERIILDRIRSVYVGTVNGPYRGTGYEARDYYIWTLRKQEDVVKFLSDIRPHLILKKLQADTVLSFIEFRKHHRYNRKDKTMEDKYCALMQVLNMKGKRGEVLRAEFGLAAGGKL